MAYLDVEPIYRIFQQAHGRKPNKNERERLRQSTIAIPATVPLEDYLHHWERNMRKWRR